jgi:CBS domain-containing protein
MRVLDVMTRGVLSCRSEESLATAAQIMWDQDCGCVPVVGADGQVIGMLTDRDACMSALHQGRPLHEILVANAMSREPVTCGPADAIEDALALMRRARVRRLPVVDQARRPIGILSLHDVARAANAGRDAWFPSIRWKDVGRAFAEVSRPWPKPAMPSRTDVAIAE